MNYTRRSVIAGAGLIPSAAMAGTTQQLPLKTEFPVRRAETCLNNARWHPLSAGARRAIQEYLDFKSSGGGRDPNYSGRQQKLVKESFAKLINASPAEISFAPSTLAGENLVVSGLGIPGTGGNVVTDALHFEGSLYLYGELQKQGLDLRIVKPRNWRIDINDLDKVIDRNTRLVALSLVSMMNGFEHDLKAVCDLAHSRGALVFADVVQAAGAVPLNVRASGVDFCACASYKWLMGDMGLGFLYARQGLHDRLRRPQYGYRQLSQMQYHLFPHDPPGDAVFEWTPINDAGGHFEVGTVANTVVAALSWSLPFLLETGVDKIQAHRVPMLRGLHKEMPRLGFEPLTSAESTSPIVTFAKKGAGQQYTEKLKKANVDVSLSEHRMRISPSLYNDQGDIDRLLELLG
ncbi:MAG: aminotransferase class V-fold PLP-dependent enzyme [Bryobacteraceae bacterium]